MWHHKYFPLLLLALLHCSNTSAHAGSAVLPGVTGGGDFSVRVKSIKESRFRTTIHQQYDFSCGSAALATLLTYHYEDPVSEQEVFKAMYEVGDKEKIRKEGFSLLDIKKYLSTRGYDSDGFRTTLEKLIAIGVPAIVLLNSNGYKHFVVVKGATANDVLIGDPSAGIKKMSRSDFESVWNGLLFLIRNNKATAKSHFNSQEEWQTRAKAPLGTALTTTELANITVFMPGRNDF